MNAIRKRGRGKEARKKAGGGREEQIKQLIQGGKKGVLAYQSDGKIG
jgi:hypothetical protein